MTALRVIPKRPAPRQKVRVYCSPRAVPFVAPCIILVLIVLLPGAMASAQVGKDVEGAADIAFIGRFPGSFISSFHHSEFDSYVFPQSTNSYAQPNEFARLELQGVRRILIYDIPASTETNTLKVFKSLEQGFLANGFETAVSCSAENGDCGYFLPRTVVSETALNQYYKYRFNEFQNLNGGHLHIYSGSRSQGDDVYYLFAVVAKSKYSAFIQYSFDLLKIAALNTEKLVLTVEYMGQELEQSGRVVLDGLFFDHDSVVLKDNSIAALNTIAAYVKQAKGKKFMVVGHTDTQGGYAYNQRLSQGRADAVLRALVDNHAVPVTMLKAVGVSYAAPIAANNRARDRDRNRRVELVEVSQF